MFTYISSQTHQMSFSNSAKHRDSAEYSLRVLLDLTTTGAAINITPVMELAQWCEANFTAFWCIEFNLYEAYVIFDSDEDLVLFKLKWT